MANSKYEYVKDFEVEDEVFLPNLIVVKIDGRDFQRFSEVHKFVKPNDEIALSLMNLCAASILEEFPHIVFAYGFSNEYSFVFKKTSRFYQRRASKVQSLIVSSFTSVYVGKWNQFFPNEKLRYPPSFFARVICCASIEVLQTFLLWRQNECHTSNQYNTCLYELVKSGKTEKEAQLLLKGMKKKEKHDLLFEQFGINYEKLPVMTRQGSCIVKAKVEDIVKYKEDGAPVKRLRNKVRIVHSKNIAGRSFWNDHPYLQKELGVFEEDTGIVNLDYVKSFQFVRKLIPSTWIVIRIDGCHFHRFAEVHKFVKPNDEQALNLMNSCAVGVLKEFQDLVFAFGESDEYSFVLKKDSHLYSRRESDLVSSIVSFFTSMYVTNWEEFFPQKGLKYSPTFDGRAVCYPSSEIIQDYLAWRQVDCHINNQYNTCFWELVKSGKSKSEAQTFLKGTQTLEKNELLKQLGISDYNTLPVIFRQGSSVFWEKEEINTGHGYGASDGTSQKRVVVSHCNIIESGFWTSHPKILDE